MGIYYFAAEKARLIDLQYSLGTTLYTEDEIIEIIRNLVDWVVKS